jgi:hypothetical protein
LQDVGRFCHEAGTNAWALFILIPLAVRTTPNTKDGIVGRSNQSKVIATGLLLTSDAWSDVGRDTETGARACQTAENALHEHGEGG